MSIEQKQDIVERLRRLDKISRLPTNIFVDAIAHIKHLEVQLARAALSQSQYANALEELDCMNKNYQALMFEFRALKALSQPQGEPIAWSNETPTVGGDYWYWPKNEGDEAELKFVEIDRDLHAIIIERTCYSESVDYCAAMQGYWAKATPPLFTAPPASAQPVRPAPLSDEQIVKLWGDYEHPRMTAAPFEFVRAILATQEVIIKNFPVQPAQPVDLIDDPRIEDILDAADEYQRFITEDSAPMLLRDYLRRAILATRR